MKGKVLFIVHDVHQNDNYFPLSIGYLAAVLRDNGHSVQIYSQDVFHYTNEELADFLDKNEFDMIGLGFMAGRYVETVRPLAKVINAHKKKAKFVLGGQGVSPIPEYILEDTQADIAVLGEGEKTIVPLMEDLLLQRDLSQRKGIAFRIGNIITVNQREELVQNLDEIPFPAWDLFPMEEYTTCLKPKGCNKEDKCLAVISSRGCINRCSFCYRMEKGLRVRSMNNLFEELKILHEKYGVTYFDFNDEMFLPNKNRIREFTQKMKEFKRPLKFSLAGRVEFAKDKESLKLLKEAGCQLIGYGFEALDQNVLNLMEKNTTVEDNYLAIENTIEAGIYPGSCFIWGGPGDTIESLNKIVDFLIKYETLGQLRTLKPITPYPGTPLYYKAITEGKLKGPADFFARFTNSERITVNFTEMSDEEVYAALFAANSKLIRNFFQKKGSPESEAENMIESFRKVYYPSCPEDLRFRGARHYDKTES